MEKELLLISQMFPNSHALLQEDVLLQKSSNQKFNSSSKLIVNNESHMRNLNTSETVNENNSSSNNESKKNYQKWLLKEILGVNSEETSDKIENINQNQNQNQNQNLELQNENNQINNYQSNNLITNSQLKFEQIFDKKADMSIEDLKSRLILDPFQVTTESTPTQSNLKIQSSSVTQQVIGSKDSPQLIGNKMVEISNTVSHPFAEELFELKR